MPSPITSIWKISKPVSWPAPPNVMSVSALKDSEACPRRRALSSATYPLLWDQAGYPQSVRTANLRGSVVHLCLEQITKALVSAGCTSIEDPAAAEVMRGLGGYTKLVNDCIDRLLTRLEKNPRAARVLEVVERELRGQAGGLRTDVQLLLVRLRPSAGARHKGVRLASGAPRRPLGLGSYAEVELRADAIGWKGIVDLLLLSEDACEIIDIKTGAIDDSHQFQVLVYALLWWRDKERNPSGQHATRLRLAYRGSDVEVPAPSENEMLLLEQDLISRTRAVAAALALRPAPPARPSPENCRYCSVRQLCDEYWRGGVQKPPAAATRAPKFVDCEVTITGQHGPLSWDAKVTALPGVKAGSSVLLRTAQSLVLSAGQRLRILDAQVGDIEPEEEPVIVTLGRWSEPFMQTEGEGSG